MTQPAHPDDPDTAADEYLQTRSRALSGARIMMARHIMIAAMSAVGTAYLLRQLGPSAWGGFAFSYMLLVTADTLLSRSLVAALLRRVVTAGEDVVASAARMCLYAGLLLAAVICLFPFAIRPFYDPPDLQLLLFATAICTLLYAARALPL